MFSPSALGGSICLRCQIRAVTRRAPPLLASAQVRGRRRQYASNATDSRLEDTAPAAEIKENVRDTDQKVGGPRQPQPNEAFPSVVAKQTLPDPPRDALNNAPELLDGSVTETQVAHDIDGNTEQDQGPRADIDLPDSALASEPDYRAKDKKDTRKPNQEEDISIGQPQSKILTKKERRLAWIENCTCPHCRKVFPSPRIRDLHTQQGCASLNPPRDRQCSKCGVTFDTKKLLHRHFAKRLCPAESEPEQLAGNDGSQKVEDILSQAAAEFSRQEASVRRDSTIDHDWSLPQHQESQPQAAAANKEPYEPAREDRTWGKEANIHTDPDLNNGKNDKVSTEPTIQEDTGVRDETNAKRTEKFSDGPLVRRIGKAARKKEHRRGDMVLVEDASKLGVWTLGKAAEVIVLRDGRQWERKAPPVEASSEEAMENGLKVEDFLDEQDVLSLDDVVKNIHGLKPERQIVSAREFKTLFRTLFDGFTILQLEKYVVWHREQSILERIKDDVFGGDEAPSEEPTIPEDVLPKRRECAWMTEQAHWTPYVDGAVEEAQYPLAGYIMKSMPPKQRLVIQLMRECWDVSIQELLDGNGRVDIRVRDLEFKLLTREYSTPNASLLLPS